jgi:hypothetical protein
MKPIIIKTDTQVNGYPRFEAGDDRLVPDDLAASLVERGVAEYAKPKQEAPTKPASK